MQTNQDAPTFTIKLTVPTVARRCIRCGQLITFAWDEFPVVADRRTMTVVATFYVHPSPEACADDVARARQLDHGETPTPYDIGLQRAQMLRALVAEAQDALLAAIPTDGVPPEPVEVPPNYARRTRESRERRGVKPYGGLL